MTEIKTFKPRRLTRGRLSFANLGERTLRGELGSGSNEGSDMMVSTRIVLPLLYLKVTSFLQFYPRCLSAAR